jgi:Nickel responsive protein SCO4226-like
VSLFLIRRDLGHVSQEDVDAASIRALSCAYNYDGLRWLTSYWDEPHGQIFCIYEATDEQQIVEHSAQSRIPCNEITAVQQVNPEEYFFQVPTGAKA